MLYLDARSEQIWADWESIARQRFGVSTMTLLCARGALDLACINEDSTLKKAGEDPDRIFALRVHRTNIQLLCTISNDLRFLVLLSVEPHPFLVESTL